MLTETFSLETLNSGHAVWQTYTPTSFILCVCTTQQTSTLTLTNPITHCTTALILHATYFACLSARLIAFPFFLTQLRMNSMPLLPSLLPYSFAVQSRPASSPHCFSLVCCAKQTCKQPLPPGIILTPDSPPPLPILDAFGNPKLEVQVSG
jgi:hypothetical protein